MIAALACLVNATGAVRPGAEVSPAYRLGLVPGGQVAPSVSRKRRDGCCVCVNTGQLIAASSTVIGRGTGGGRK
jgi:hypothetical protein